MNVEALIVVALFGTACSLSCQCSTDAGGIRCYNGWCDVQNLNGKVGACALVRIGIRQHFACVRVKPTSEDSCRVTRSRNGEQQVRCWCRENYCNTDLADRVDEDRDLQEDVVVSAEEIQATTVVTDTVSDDFVIERNYDMKDEDYLNEYDSDELVWKDRKDLPTLPPTPQSVKERTTVPMTTIPPWRREYPADRKQIQFDRLMSTPLSPPLPPRADQRRALQQLETEERKRIQEQYVRQRDHLRRIEYERKTQPTVPSTSTTTTTTTTTTPVTTTSVPPFVFPKGPSRFADDRSPEMYEDNAMIFDRRLYEEQAERRRHEELLRKEQLAIVERARAQAEAKLRLLKQNMTKPRAWLQVGMVNARSADERRSPPVRILNKYRPFDLNNINFDEGERSRTTIETVQHPLTAVSGSEPHHKQIDMVVNSSDVKEEQQNERSTVSASTSTTMTSTFTTTSTSSTALPSSSTWTTEKTPSKTTTSTTLSATTTTTKPTVRTTSDSSTSRLTTTISTPKTTVAKIVDSTAHFNLRPVPTPTRNVTKVIQQGVSKDKLDDGSSTASTSSVFAATIILIISLLS